MLMDAWPLEVGSIETLKIQTSSPCPPQQRTQTWRPPPGQESQTQRDTITDMCTICARVLAYQNPPLPPSPSPVPSPLSSPLAHSGSLSSPWFMRPRRGCAVGC